MALAKFTVIQTPNQAAANPELVSLAGVNSLEPVTFKAGNSINSRIAGVEIGKTYLAELSEVTTDDGYHNLRVTGAMPVTTVRDLLDAQVLKAPVKFLTTPREAQAGEGAETVTAGKRTAKQDQTPF